MNMQTGMKLSVAETALCTEERGVATDVDSADDGDLVPASHVRNLRDFSLIESVVAPRKRLKLFLSAVWAVLERTDRAARSKSLLTCS